MAVSALLLNLGSGQRRFPAPWINVDCVSRDGQVPDLILDIRRGFPWADNSIDIIVLNQVWEHLHLNEGDGTIRECYRVLRPGGSLIITCPDLRALCQRWLTRQIDDYIFCVNLYGAWQGQPGDDHHWAWTHSTLAAHLLFVPVDRKWSTVQTFDWRELPAKVRLPKDWWCFGLEAIK